MQQTVRTLFVDAAGDLGRAWRPLAITDAAYKMVAAAVLMPTTAWVLYWLRTRTSERVVADVDIALFFLTTPMGIATLMVGATLGVAITAVEVACLIAIGLGTSQGVRLEPLGAWRFGAAHAWTVLRLTSHIVIRAIGGVVPFLLAAGLVYLVLLREHDINYYLSQRPAQFWMAGAVVAGLAAGLVWMLAGMASRWVLATPLVIVEGVPVRRALDESTRRAAGSRALILTTLAIWAAASLALAAGATCLVQAIGRAIAPQLAGSLIPLLLFVAVLLVFGAVLALAVSIVNISMFSLLITRLYLGMGAPQSATAVAPYAAMRTRRLSTRGKILIVSVSLLAALGVGLVGFAVNHDQHAVLVIAHRGSSAAAPENTLAAFRLAAEQRTDFVELDVQESADGQVLVVHDSDLMKVGGNRTKIWEGDAATLRAVDIGSSTDPRFSAERVPTLAEALAACKHRCGVVVELKSYGHNRDLEQRVAAIVEAAGMEHECVFMSLDHDMARTMKTLRPAWRVGLLVAKAMGDLTELDADFLAVEARMATPSFVRRAHRAGQDVYVWTVNDPAWMLESLSRGVDGLITDTPDVARTVIDLRERMTESQRFLLALLIRFGASTEALAATDALRP